MSENKNIIGCMVLCKPLDEECFGKELPGVVVDEINGTHYIVAYNYSSNEVVPKENIIKIIKEGDWSIFKEYCGAGETFRKALRGLYFLDDVDEDDIP